MITMVQWLDVEKRLQSVNLQEISVIELTKLIRSTAKEPGIGWALIIAKAIKLGVEFR